MNITELRNQLSVRGKNGIPFLISGSIIWMMITVILLQPLDMFDKNIVTLFLTGLTFPVAQLISKLMKSDWRMNDPLGMLGFYLNMAQFLYLPFLIWALYKSPEHMIWFFAIITGAHLFPFGWFYKARAYDMMAPIMVGVITVTGWNIHEKNLWILSSMMAVLILVLVAFLYRDYLKKVPKSV